MLRLPVLLLLAVLMPTASQPNTIPADGPAYTSDGQLRYPEHYREWVYLTSGVNMSYNPKAQADGHTMFDNVFVNPSAWRAFQQVGTWPDGTVMVLENRGGESGKSINKHGQTQSVEVMGMEIHVKDARLKGGWGFFEFDNQVSARLTPRPASCYTCHEEHAAVDTTFVQFYPTLVGLAQKKGTLSPAYLKEIATPAAK
ncbi:cytochrome P460 family protein [Granulicella arctica]|uniref:cytochrome P460 family protein n=1 Tax=Granulicella arctica TaxID=940613 RepID=UPI0021E0E710|nr:cytochrome P460 family protein [Granulicella arctica]